MLNSSSPYLDKEIMKTKTLFVGSHCGIMIQQCRENATCQPPGTQRTSVLLLQRPPQEAHHALLLPVGVPDLLQGFGSCH